MSERWDTVRTRSVRVARRAGRLVFRDRTGLVLFLATLCAVTLTWRAGVFINDNFTLVRGLDALSQGHVWLDRAGPNSFVAPGTNVRDGYVYGRNYGQLVLSLPALWALQAIDAIVNLHVALVAGWHLLVLALVVQIQRVTGYDRRLLYGATGAVVASFLANTALVRTFTAVSLPLLALQVTAAVAVSLVAVCCYRLVTRRHGTRVGTLAGFGAVLATPLGLWATIPKRHAFSALLVVAVLYAFARSRDADARRSVAGFGPVPVYRAAAYVLVGLFTTIHAAEALFVFFALVAVDIPTAPSNDRRTLAFVGGLFALSMIPFFVTNSLVTGEMLRPPRAMGDRGLTAPAQESVTDAGGGGGGNGSGSGAAGGSGGSSGSSSGGIQEFLINLGAGPVGVIVSQILDITTASLAALSNVERLTRTYFLSTVDGIAQNDSQFLGINLALVEAGPLLGAAAGAVVAGVAGGLRRLRTRLEATEVLAFAIVLGFLLIYSSRLPLNTQVTVRYLLVLYPLGAVLLARSATVGRLLADHRDPLLWSYTAGVALGSQLLLAYFVLGGYAVGEAARVHALLGAALGLAVAVASVASALDRRTDPVAAVVLGLAAAAATVFTVLAGITHFAFVGEYVLPVVGWVSDLITAAG
jgi:4-amino-4-deoxy-L-arabinose transferase-like glycosyltransferase